MGLRIPDKEFWYNRNVFITGHTGFKGSWLSYLLTLMGANVYGYALQPNTKPSLFQLLRLSNDMFSFISDIRNQDELTDRLTGSKASVVFHMAAQPLVRESYNNPKYTFDTNIMGTVNILEAIKQASTVEAVVVITTDKCYKNIDDDIPYSEDDPLGGYDPYSASKAAAEIVTSSYRDSFFNETNSTLIATARAGNVIGGGD